MNPASNPVENSRSPVVPSMHFMPMRVDDLETVLMIENVLYPHPWTHGNFLDSLYSGYEGWVLRGDADAVAGYFMAMPVLDELHLLNITVRGDLQRRGVGRMMLNRVMALALEKKMTSILLEVRPSNLQALAVYERYGFSRIGLRKAYYPAMNNTREDAIVMRLPL